MISVNVGLGFVDWVWNRSHSSVDLDTDARLPRVAVDRRRARLLGLTRAVAGERRGKRG